MRTALFRDLLLTLDLDPAEVDAAVPDLEFLAGFKYDLYEMFGPGTRFYEHFYLWLQQFPRADRPFLLALVRDRLIFISQREMQELARFLFYDRNVPTLLDHIVQDQSLPAYAYARAFHDHFPQYLRRCLFVGLSDGAKIDFFRRHNIAVSQEQVLPYYRGDAQHYLEALRRETGDSNANFTFLFLLDDFSGSGFTLLRRERDPDTDAPAFGGSLQRVLDLHPELVESATAIYVCHYITTETAQDNLLKLLEGHPSLRGKVFPLPALLLPSSLGLTPANATRDALTARISAICEQHYDSRFEDAGTRAGGGIRFGYGGVGLPLVLYSNTPNNSLYILWLTAETAARDRSFEPLFRRMKRHREG